MSKIKKSAGGATAKKASTASKKESVQKAGTNNAKTTAAETTKNAATTKTDANNHDMKSSKLSDREKEMQNDIKNGKEEIDVQPGDKVGNAARAMADKDGNGELSDTETEALQSNTKAILEKNPELASLAEKNGLDINNPEDLDAIMQLQLDEAKLPDNKLKVPNAEEVEKAQEEIDEKNEELPEAEKVDAPHKGGNCNTPHEEDMIAQISKLNQEGKEALDKGDFATAISKFEEALSKGTTQLEKEMNGGGQDKEISGSIVDPANSNQITQKGALNKTQQTKALKTLAQSNPIINQAMGKAQESPRVQKLLDLMAYSQQGLETAQQGGEKGDKKTTGTKDGTKKDTNTATNTNDITKKKIA